MTLGESLSRRQGNRPIFDKELTDDGDTPHPMACRAYLNGKWMVRNLPEDDRNCERGTLASKDVPKDTEESGYNPRRKLRTCCLSISVNRLNFATTSLASDG